MVELLIVLGLVAWQLGLPLVAVVSAARYEAAAWEEAGRSKPGTIIGVLCTCGLGAIYYLVAIRPAVRTAAADLEGFERRGPWTEEQRQL